MQFLRSLWRFSLVVAHFAYASVELAITRPHTRRERATWLSRFCARVLHALGVTFTVNGPIPDSGAVISNHLSALDILLHSAVHPCVFVSKVELRKTPVLGWMSFMSGTVYVARGQGGSASKAAEGMAKGFRDGLPVVFFPEGTTGVGDEIAMPFRSGLLAQSIAAGAPIVPSFITYAISARDKAAGKTLRDDLHWGPHSMVDHIWRLVSLHGMHATLQFAELPIRFTDAAVADRKLAAAEAREAVLRLSAAPASWSETGV